MLFNLANFDCQLGDLSFGDLAPEGFAKPFRRLGSLVDKDEPFYRKILAKEESSFLKRKEELPLLELLPPAQENVEEINQKKEGDEEGEDSLDPPGMLLEIGKLPDKVSLEKRAEMADSPIVGDRHGKKEKGPDEAGGDADCQTLPVLPPNREDDHEERGPGGN